MWTLFEPIHAVTYFTPEARAAYEEQGLHGFWRGYFAGRAAPLGPTGAAVVTASFYNFAPGHGAPGPSPASGSCRRRVRSCGPARTARSAALRRLLAGRNDETAVAADRLARVAADLDWRGRSPGRGQHRLCRAPGLRWRTATRAGPALAGGHRAARAPRRRSLRGHGGRRHRRLRGAGSCGAHWTCGARTCSATVHGHGRHPATHQAMTASIDATLRPYDLTRTGYRLMTTLLLSREGTRPLGQLSKQLWCIRPRSPSPSTCSRNAVCSTAGRPHGAGARSLSHADPAGRELLDQVSRALARHRITASPASTRPRRPGH